MIFVQFLGLNLDDYVFLILYIYYLFYFQFVIEIQDNWCNGLLYNLLFDEFMVVMDNVVKNGYIFVWGSDVSEEGFICDGIVVVLDVVKGVELIGLDMVCWIGMIVVDKCKELILKLLLEMKIIQEMCQIVFDNWEIIDDYGMIIYGIVKDQNGKEYFMVKNFWGINNKYKGIWYVFKVFVVYKIMNILVYKDVFFKDIVKKLGIK